MNDYRRVHRLTPLLQFWTVLLALLAALLFNLNATTFNSLWGFISGDYGRAWLSLLAGIGVFVVVCLAIWLISRIWWQAIGYRLSEEEIGLKRGVINRQLRTARYDRIQAVDVVESLIARLFRLAAVRVETAGGGNSVIEIAYLRKAEAEALRGELLERTRGTPGPAAESSAEPLAEPGPGEPDLLVPEIPIQRSLLGAALRPSAIISVLAVGILVLSPLGLATLIPVLVGVVPVVWNRIDQSWRFNARLDDEVVNLSYGLADRRRQSIPLHRIHGVSIHQPMLWRMTGWWEVSVTVAGYGNESDKKSGTSSLLPVGSREQAVALAAVLSPLSRPELESHARPEGASAPTFTSPRIARWVSPVDLMQQAVTLLPQAAIVHRGRLGRRVSIIEPSHIQELTLQRGPLQQLLGLCTIRLDLVAGPVHMAGEDLSSADGEALLDQLRRRKLPEPRLHYDGSHARDGLPGENPGLPQDDLGDQREDREAGDPRGDRGTAGGEDLHRF